MKEREGAAAAGKPLPIRVDKVKYDELARDLPPDLQAATLVAYTFGWRVQSEVLTLKRRQLDLATATLRLDMGSTKNDDGRVIYLTSEVKAALTEQIARVEAFQRTTGVITPYFFPHLHGGRAPRAKSSARRGRQPAGRPGAPADCSTTFAVTAVRNMERAGVPRSVAMKITGHRTEAVYRRYAIVSDADLKEAARKLTGTFSGTSATTMIESRVLSSR